MVAISEMFQLLSPFSVDREINGKTVTFYTCSVKTCARLSPFLTEMAGHLSILIGGNAATGQGTVAEDWQDADGAQVQKTTTQAINPDLDEMRSARRQRAVEGAVSACFDEKNRAALGDLMMDSLKDNFKRGEKRPREECLGFIDEMDPPTLTQFLQGLALANAKVFGDLGKGLGRAVQDQAARLLGKVNEQDPKEAPPQTDG